MKYAFLTATPWANLYEDDQLAAQALSTLGHEVIPVVWSHTSPGALNVYDAVVMRSVWDWYQRPLDFQAFLEKLAAALTVPLMNPHSMLLEYLDKTYLRTLEQRGVSIVPTRWLTRDALPSLPQLVASAGWSRAVIKPTLSANSNSTLVFSSNEARRVMRALEQRDHSGYLVQPYLPEIEHEGEWSLIFFGGQYSHAVRKFPKVGDFRVQREYGGRVEMQVPHASVIAQATAIVTGQVPNAAYARVDGVVRDEHLMLMELEVVEPELFFRCDPDAATRFARHLVDRVAPAQVTAAK